MKITLKNFKCHRDNTFEFPDTGLVLFSGISGSGKSSLLKAIYYAFYGKVKKPCSFGTNSCSVEIEYKNIFIKRSTKPNILRVVYEKQTLEDAPAQELLDRLLNAKREEFDIACYIPQKKNTCILSLPPLEQMSLIGTLSYETEESKDLKEKIKRQIREKNDELTKCKTRLEYSKKEYDNILEIKPEDVKLEMEISENMLKNLESELETFSETLQELLNEKQKLEKDFLNFETSQKRDEELKTELVNIDEKILKGKKLLKELRENLKNCEKPENIEELKNKIEFLKLKRQFENIKTTEIKETEKNIKKLESELWKIPKQEIYQKLEIYNESKKILKKFEESKNTKKELSKKFERLVKNLEEETKDLKCQIDCNFTYECPNCQQYLKLENDTLLKTDILKKVKTDVETLKIKLEKSEKNLTEYKKNLEEIKKIDDEYSKEKLEELETLLRTNEFNERELERLKRNGFSKTLQTIQKNLERFDFSEDFSEDLEKLEQELETIQKNSGAYNEWCSQLKKIDCELSNFITMKQKTENSIKNLKYNSEKEKLEEVKQKIKELKQKNLENRTLKPKIDKYLEFQKYSENLKKRRETFLQDSDSLKTAELEYTSFLVLKEKYRQAEILAVESTLKSINEHTQYYLDSFFTENNLFAKLQTVNENKLEIKTDIQYKGHSYEDISQLSGGEFDRCVLASVCGVNTMLGCGIVILDESLSSLDADTNTDIINFLKEFSETKLIIVCSHEAVKGIFDHVVEI